MRYRLFNYTRWQMGSKYRIVFIPIITLVFFLSQISCIGASSELMLLNFDTLVSMDFQDVSLKDLLKVFSIQTGLNFIASEAVQDREITLYFDKVPVKEAMDQLFKANNLSYEYNPISNIIIVKDWGKPGIETITKVFALKYATVSSSALTKKKDATLAAAGGGGEGGGSEGGGKGTSIASAIEKVLSEYGKVIEDSRTNSLIVTDIPSQFPRIEKMLELLDIPVPQVMLEVEMLDVSKNLVDKFGFEFGNNPITIIVPGEYREFGKPFYFGDSSDRGIEGGVTLGKKYARMLDFLKTQTDTKYLARPRLLTLNNEPAEIRIATDESIGIQVTAEAETGTTGIQPERTETGVILSVVPQVSLATGEITMFIYPKVSEAVQGNTFLHAGQTYQYRDPEERSTKSMVKVKDGETVIVGGLIRNEFSEALTKVPILGDIPLVGALFRHRDKTRDRERELLVFITPHIIKETPVELARVNNLSGMNALPEREQQLSESATQRSKSINTFLDDFER